MRTIVIDEQFKRLLPPLSRETFELLEENILQNGCRDSLVLWGDVLIDGHNRYEICTKHDIPFNTIDKEFESREAALIWIITNQISRRNLTPMQMSDFRGMHYKADRIIITNKVGNNQYISGKVVAGHNDQQPKRQDTAARLSKQYDVSPKTVRRDVKVHEALDAIGEASPEARRMILYNEVKIDKKVLESLASNPEEVKRLAIAIENGTYKKEKPAPHREDESDEPAGSAELSEPAEPTGQAEPLVPLKPIDSIMSAVLPLDPVIDNIQARFSNLHVVTQTADRAKLKAALRLRIARLENLYEKILYQNAI